MSNEEKFRELAEPMIKFLAEHYSPHATIIISNEYAELVEGVMAFTTKEYIQD